MEKELYIEQQDRKINAVMYNDMSDEEIINRLSGRLICSKCQTPYHKTSNPPKVEGICDKCGGKLVTRPDDNPETVRNRLKVYHESTFPLVEFYQKRGLLSELDGKTKIADLRDEIEEKKIHPTEKSYATATSNPQHISFGRGFRQKRSSNSLRYWPKGVSATNESCGALVRSDTSEMV